MRRNAHLARGRRTSVAVAAFLLLTGGLAACSKSEGPGDVLGDFLTGWTAGNLDKVGFVTATGGAISAANVVDQIQTLSGELVKTPPVLSKQGDPKITGDSAAGSIKLEWTLTNGAVWSYQSTVQFTKRDKDGWQIVWEPSIVNSKLTAGDKLALRQVPAERAAILDATGAPLVQSTPVVTVGVSPNKITDLTALTKSLNAAFKKINADIDLSGLKARIAKANPGAFLDLVTLRQTDYDKIRDDVRPLKGTVFASGTRMLAPSRQFARALLGTVDPATKDDIDAHPGTITASDSVGHGGLQEKFDSTLRGTPGLSVVIARKSPEDDTVVDTQLFSTKPVAGTPVKTTLDVKTQNAADAAVATEKQPSALVAIKISDSSVLAVSNGPDAAAVNTAMTGQVPPGSTFKMVSALGLLTKKQVTPDTIVDCPKSKTVDGHEFKNAAGEALGKVPFRTDFAKSCNTAFINLAPKLGADGLTAAATSVGLGAQWDLGIASFSGKISTGGSATELAAAMFGQGTTVVSPLAMAGATAAVERGKFQQPKLVTSPAPTTPAPDGAALDSTAVAALHAIMREVVTKGTGTGLLGVPGKPVYGKTGTAEFDNGSDATHAWFVGWQGDVAFAVLVQKGGAGAAAAVPIVDKFLTTLDK
jgi:cell division protein FtsI/penicillin-binding protein 2